MSDWKSRAKPVGEYNPNWQQNAKPIAEPKVIEEMHPSISLKDRAIVKNFAQSPQAALAYLQKQHPDLEFQLKNGDQYLVRAKGEPDFKVLDPDTGFFSKDILRDAMDIGYDTVAGATEGLATTAGAVGGAIAGAPLAPFTGGTSVAAGGMGGAMLASGAASATNEGIRQKLGQALGIPQEVDYSDVATAGGVGVIAPLTFGAGKHRGAIKAGWDGAKAHVFPKLGSMASRVSSETLTNYSDDAVRSSVDNLEKTGVTDYTRDAYNKLVNYLKTNKQQATDDLVQAIDATGKPVNIGGAKKVFHGAQSNVSPDGTTTNMDQKKLDVIKRYYEEIFGLPVGDRQKVGSYVVPGTPGQQAKTISHGSYTVPGQNVPEHLSIDPKTGMYVTRNTPKVGDTQVPIVENTGLRTNAKTGLQEQVPDIPGMMPTTVDIIDDPRNVLDPLTMTMRRAQTELPDQVSAQRAWQLQKDLNQMAGWEQGMTPADALSKETARGAYGAINNSLDEASEGVVPEMKTRWKHASDAETQLLPKFEGATDPDSIQKTWNVLSNMDGNQRKILKEQLSKLASSGQLDLSQEAKVLGTFRELGKPSMMPVSSGGAKDSGRNVPLAIGGSALGSYLGYRADAGPGATGASGVAGGLVGYALGSPAAMKAIIKANAKGKALKKSANQITGTEDETIRRGLRSGWSTELLKDIYSDGE